MSPRSSIISPPSETRWPRRAVLLADVREKEGESLAAALGTWVHGSGCVAGPLAAPRGQEGVIPPPAQRHRPPFVSTDRWGNRLPEGLRKCGGPEPPAYGRERPRAPPCGCGWTGKEQSAMHPMSVGTARSTGWLEGGMTAVAVARTRLSRCRGIGVGAGLSFRPPRRSRGRQRLRIGAAPAAAIWSRCSAWSSPAGCGRRRKDGSCSPESRC